MLQANNIKKLLIALNLVMAPIVAHAQLVGGTDTAPLGGLAIGYAQNDANGGIAIGSQHQGMGYTSIQGAAYYSTVVGTGASTTGAYSSLFGAGTTSASDYGSGFGYGSSVFAVGGTAIGYGSQVSGDWSVAIGAYSRALDPNVVSFGSGAAFPMPGSGPGTRRLVNVSDGIADSDAATVRQVNAVQSQVTTLSTSVSNLSTTVSNLSSGGGGGTVDTTARVAAAAAQTTADVALTTANTAQTTANTALSTATTADAKATTALTAVNELGSRVDNLEQKIDRVARQANAGTALALAMQNGGVALAQGETAVGAGIGGYGGEAALAVTVAHSLTLHRTAADQERSTIKEAVISAGVGTSASGAGGTGMRVGVSFKF